MSMDCNSSNLTLILTCDTSFCGNPLYPINCDCNATFGGDPDIAGPGVIIGFVLTAWITCFVAAIAAYYETLETYIQYMIGRQSLPSAAPYQPLQQSRKPISRLRKGSLRFLVSLSDVQVITGTAILVAGLGQLPRITYYHESFVNNYWLLTLNSFWAAQICNRSSLEEVTEELSTSRTLIVFFSVVLAISFQIITNIREWHQWDFLESGRCYITHDTAGEGQAWLWVAGLILFASSLGLTLFLRSWAWMAVVSTKIDQIWYNVRSKYNGVVGVVVNHLNQKSHSANLHWLQKLSSAIILLAYLIEVACRVFWFLFTQFFSVWVCGQGAYGIEALVYMGFAAWSTYDIIDIKLSNRSLVDGSETKWGFGQILPVGLLAMLVVNAVDAFGS